MIMRQLQADIAAIEDNQAVFEESNFAARARAIDDLEFQADQIADLLPATEPPAPLMTLKEHVQGVRSRLEAIDDSLFRRLRAEIRSGACRGAELERRIRKYAECGPRDGERNVIGYDIADAFVNGLLAREAPQETVTREQDMVAYQATPVRIILDLSQPGNVAECDVFYDLGSGLGRVALLVGLLTGATAKGVEIEPAYCEYARQSAEDLNVSHVEFVQADARDADYRDATVFFMYTPFKGEMMREVLGKMQRQSQGRRIRVYTYGPCTFDAARCRWLERLDRNGDNIYRLARFTSVLR